MLPSIVANELTEAVRRFLVTAYEPSDAFFAGVVQRFVEAPDAVGKGPYLQIGLPFRVGSADTHFFSSFETRFPGFVHQEQAWQRLATDRDAANTLVATGTGSGKTECFLYPLLDHCARAREAGEVTGIKALVIYPMNALANDQARRFAEEIVRTPAFHGIRVGMYVGGSRGLPGTGKIMTPASVITDHETLRVAPPDILLTNYKMLDYLLIRPKDRGLWQHNDANTLRYVVVDELHTFDGAQGTDLAMLLRRLRARLQSPKEHIVFVGTSATLGDGDDAPLREYAQKIFDSPFPLGSVVTESRDDVSQFLGDAPIEHVLQGREDMPELLDSARRSQPVDAIHAWFGLFFPDQPPPSDPHDPMWRAELGQLLKRHLLVHNLLRVLKGGVSPWADLCEQLSGPMPAAARTHASQVLDALVGLLAWSRSDSRAQRPLVTTRMQLWYRELRRLVASVSGNKDDVALVSAADLKAAPERIHLPLVQCSECHATGWLSQRSAQDARVSDDLEVIYNAWFRSAPETARLYPERAVPKPRCDFRTEYLCGQCGGVQGEGGKCALCGNDDLVRVIEVLEQRQTDRQGAVFNWHVKVCPACGARDRLLLLGARNATLGAQIIEQLWASHYNDDKKLIAFSDSVQDAAHRAGFFGSRTYLNNVRMAMAQSIEALAKPSIEWPSYLRQLPDFWLANGRMSQEQFVTEFIGPNMLWQHDWDRLQETGRLPADGHLLERVRKRLAWQPVSEFTYLSRRGRTLDRLGIATLALPADALDAPAEATHNMLVEQFGLRTLQPATVLQWLWGFVIHLRQRGAVTHPEMEAYAREGGLYSFLRAQRREDWLPPMHPRAAYPAMLSLGSHRDFDVLTRRGESWYEGWLRACFGPDGVLLPKSGEQAIYVAAIEALLATGILSAADGAPGRSLAVTSERMALWTDTVQLRSTHGRHALTVPSELGERLLGMPCLDAMHECYDVVDGQQLRASVFARRFRQGEIRRVLAAEHTGLLEREPRERLEERFKGIPPPAQPWYENLLSATPTLEMGVDIGDLSSVLLCSVPPDQASYLQRSGRAGRRDGSALIASLASGASPHDLYFYAQPMEMMAGAVSPPGVFLEAAEVLRRQLMAFCIDGWVASGIATTALPDKTGPALDAVERADQARFPYTFLEWVHAQEADLLRRFLELLGTDAPERVTRRLTEYMRGEGDADGLRTGLLKLLEGQVKERAVLRARADAIKRQVQGLKQQPKDESTQAKIDELTRVRESALAQSRNLTATELLRTLTDAGLIPNYAFPEAGIELKSILWRRRAEHEEGTGKYITLPIETYERPAASALSEFAPENQFYANRRRVEINQIALDQAQVETWRFCPACSHVENLEFGDQRPACPRCGDAMWANVTQKRTLLRFKQAIASTDDRDARIDDRSDDREPTFFLRQLLVDAEPDDVTVAWKLESDQVAFGFEFIRRAMFRDINFGERGKSEDVFKVADHEASRPGFKLCKHCGMVQKPPRARSAKDGNPAPAQHHARDCQAYGGDDPANLFECLYLYREFTSEAVRILVPFTRTGNDETELQSFMAALHLGLKRRFGGRVDHLRITDQEEPGPDGASRRHYVLLYDSVPGGTGYLQQLLSEDAQTLTEVLASAYDAVQACSCNADPQKDGCYRCVYQYRRGRAMEQVSRRAAQSVLAGLVGNFDHLQRVKSISEVYENPNLESVLESRFVECLHRLGGVQGIPTVRVVQDVVDGKTGWLIEIGSERYWLRPQVDIGPDSGVSLASRPDFVISPARANSPRRPITVFADGWSYHEDRLRDDARKRSALVASGRYWVWSITWDDVQHALAGSVEGGVAIPGLHRRDAARGVADAVRSVLGVTRPASAENAVAILLRWLAEPSTSTASVLDQQQRMSASILAALTINPDSDEKLRADEALQEIARVLPDGCAEVQPGCADAQSHDPTGACVVTASWPRSFMEAQFEGGFGAVELCASRAQDKSSLKEAWRQWLAWFNCLQWLPNVFLIEEEGMLHGDYANLGRRPIPAVASDPSNAAWGDAIASALAPVREGLQYIRESNLPPPDQVGFEYAQDGQVVAEAELAWEAAHIVVLTEDQWAQRQVWNESGWRVFASAEPKWYEPVAQLLREQI